MTTDLKEISLTFFDQNPGSTVDDLCHAHPEVPRSAAESYHQFWRKLAAWQYAQGITKENKANQKPLEPKKNNRLREQIIPSRELRPPVSVTAPDAHRSLPVKESSGPPVLTLPPSLLENIGFLRFITENQEAIKSLVDQYKNDRRIREDLIALGEAKVKENSLLTEIDPAVVAQLEKVCQILGITRGQALNMAVRDFVQKFL